MKFYSQLALAGLICLALLLVSCGGDDGPKTPEEEQLEKLAGVTWGDQNASGGGGSTVPAPAGTVIVDGQDVSANFIGFSLSFTDGQYNTTGAEDLFSATGTWAWVDEDAQQLLLDDGKQITILELTETIFRFSFIFNATGGEANSAEGISGSYIITLNR